MNPPNIIDIFLCLHQTEDMDNNSKNGDILPSHLFLYALYYFLCIIWFVLQTQLLTKISSTNIIPSQYF